MSHKGFSYRIYPTPEQEVSIKKAFGTARFVYNWALDLRQNTYKETGKGLTYCKISKKLTALKQEYPWLKETERSVPQYSLIHLTQAYANFFRRLKEGKKGKAVGFPTYKTKKTRKQSYSTSFAHSNIEVFADAIKLPTLGLVKARIHRPIEGHIKSVTVKRMPTGKYFASVLCDVPEPAKLPARNAAVGIDLGLHTFATLSTGEKINLPESLYKADKKIRKANRELHHRVKGSRNRAKARIKLAKAYEKLKNRREDFQHKLSLRLVRENQAIGLETLAVLNLMRRRKTGKISKKTGKEITHRGMGRAFALAAFGGLIHKIGYKADWYGTYIVYSDRFYPSSQLCHCCGYQNPLVKDLKVREWTCPKCHAHHDRDINAALNLLGEVLKVFPELNKNQDTNRDGIARINACGDLTSTQRLISAAQVTSLKQEITGLGQW
jgi:putative transposase